MTVLRRFVRDERRSFVKWTVAAVLLMALSAVLYPTVRSQPGIEETFEALPEAVRQLMGSQEGISISSPAGYLQGRIFSTTLPIVLLLFGIGLGARSIGGAEDDGTLELLVAQPVSRGRVAAERYLGTAAAIVALGAVSAVVVLATSAPVGLLDGVSIPNLLGALVAATALALLHGSIAFGVGCAGGGRGSAVAAAAGVAVGGYVLHGLVTAVTALEPLRLITPWWWYLERNAVARGPTLAATVLPAVIALVATGVGAWAFHRRDLH